MKLWLLLCVLTLFCIVWRVVAGKTLSADDVLGVGWVYKANAKKEDLNYVFFTLNGEDLGPRYWSIRATSTKAGLSLAPAVVAFAEGATFSVNFGQRPFKSAEMEALRTAAAARGEVCTVPLFFAVPCVCLFGVLFLLSLLVLMLLLLSLLLLLLLL